MGASMRGIKSRIDRLDRRQRAKATIIVFQDVGGAWYMDGKPLHARVLAEIAAAADKGHVHLIKMIPAP